MKDLISKIKHKVFSNEMHFPAAEKVLPFVLGITGAAFVFGLVITLVSVFGNKTELEKAPPSKESTLTPIKTLPDNLEAIASRNIFNINGTIPDIDSNGVCPEKPIKSELPYKINGILFGGNSISSLAVIDSGGHIQSYRYGEKLPQGGKLTGIEKGRILVTNKNCPEYIELIYPTPPLSRDAKSNQNVAGVNYRENGFERSGNNVAVSKQWINNILNNNFAKTLEEAKASPNIVGAQIKGFVLTHISPNSVYSKLGLKNGDIVSSIGGIELNDAARAIQTLNAMRNENNVELQVIRNGKPFTLRVNVQ